MALAEVLASARGALAGGLAAARAVRAERLPEALEAVQAAFLAAVRAELAAAESQAADHRS